MTAKCFKSITFTLPNRKKLINTVYKIKGASIWRGLEGEKKNHVSISILPSHHNQICIGKMAVPVV